MSEVLTSKEINSVLSHLNSTLAPSVVKVLILDDSPDDIALLKSHLDKLPTLKTKITMANTVDKAVKIARRKQFDIAFVDFLLQAETGTELVKELGGRFGGFPSILTTGMLTPDVINRSIHSGVMAILDKEMLTPNLMESTIRSTLNNWKMQEYCINRIAEQQKSQKPQLSDWALGRKHSPDHDNVFDLQQIVTDAVQSLPRGKRQNMNLSLLDDPLHVYGNREELTAALSQILQAIETEAEIETDQSSFFELGVLKIKLADPEASHNSLEQQDASIDRIIGKTGDCLGDYLAAYRINEHQIQVMISMPRAMRTPSVYERCSNSGADEIGFFSQFISRRKIA